MNRLRYPTAYARSGLELHRYLNVSYWYWEEDLEEEEQRIQKEEGKK